MTDLPPTERSRLRRVHERGRYDRATIDRILDAGLICHVGYVIDGLPYVTPTIYWREGDRVYWHGSSASRMLRRSEGEQVCLTVTHLDGLVLARSAFHHSANYRSVMLFGRAELVADKADKLARLQAFVEGLYPGRWKQLRPITGREIKATTVLSLPIAEGSAKLRAGPPIDDEADYALPVWAGVIPARTALGQPEPCPRAPADMMPLAPETTFPEG
ncbi:MAG: pyridoxamine 5'-phosphate oxidase family protein [Inquilinus sp.]|nr:pyridoxamine 5'-phosphate oxidase family protein [Inquilinus sp.]